MKNRKPVIGEAFRADMGDPEHTFHSLMYELQYYGPRRFKRLITACRAMAEAIEANPDDMPEGHDDLINEVCDALTDWAQTHNEFLSFGTLAEYPECFGFSVDVESALSEADFRISDLAQLPKGATGLAVHVNDHGNVSAYRCARGRAYELFAVV